MKILLLSILHIAFQSYAVADTSQQTSPEAKTSDIIQEEQELPGTEMELEKMNTSPNPVQGPDDASQGTIQMPQNNDRKKQEQQDQPEVYPEEEREQELEDVNFIEEEQA